MKPIARAPSPASLSEYSAANYLPSSVAGRVGFEDNLPPEEPLLASSQEQLFRPSSFEDRSSHSSLAAQYTSSADVVQGELQSLQRDDGRRSTANEISLEPIPPPPGYPPLDYRPTILKSKVTIGLMVLYLWISGSIAALYYTSGSDRTFHVSSQNVQLAARYGPGLTATITVLLFRQTTRDVMRMKPFIAMADQNGRITAGASPFNSVAGAFFPWTALGGLTPTSAMYIFIFVSNSIVGFLVAAKTVLLGTTQDGSNWILTVRKEPAYFLMTGYIIMELFNLIVTIWAWSLSTGLKWDPASIQDYVALFARGNALHCFSALEHSEGWTFSKGASLRAPGIMSSDLRFRIGYWKRRTEGSDASNPHIVYGISTLDGAPMSITPNDMSQFPDICVLPRHTACESLPRPRFNNIADSQRRTSTTGRLLADPGSRLCECREYPKCRHYPYQRSTGLSKFGVCFWMLIVFAALVACIYALAKRLVSSGFSMPNTWGNASLSYNSSNHNTDNTSTHGDKNGTITLAPDDYYISSSLFNYALVFRALPTLLAGYFCLTYFPFININTQFTEPYMGMFETPGPAATSISLAYLTSSALEVPLIAFNYGHWRVLSYSIMNTLSPLFPIFVAGLFTITATSSRVYITFGLPAFVVIFTYLLAYSIFLPFALPQRYRRLPRLIWSMADLMGQCHQAHFLADPVFDISHAKSSKEKMEACVLLRGNKYLFGLYRGRDGRQHLGFDVKETESCGLTGDVIWVPPKPNWIHRAAKPRSLFRRIFGRVGGKQRRIVQEEAMKLQPTFWGVDAGGFRRQQGDPFMHRTSYSAVEV